ncbi:MAG: hypothetical protein RR482_00120 [Clostridia bacterium]
MDENEVKVSDATEQEAPDTGVEASAESTAEAVQAEKEPAAGTTEPATEQKSDTETEQETASEKPEKGDPTAGREARKLADGADAASAGLLNVAAVNEQLETAKKQLLTARAEGAAMQAGIRPDRIKQAVKLAELSGIDPLHEGADEKIVESLKTVGKNMPEWLTQTGTGATGAFARKTDQPKDAFERGFGKV